MSKEKIPNKKGKWQRRWDAPASKWRFDWVKNTPQIPVDLTIPPEAPPMDPNLLTKEDLEQQQREKREELFRIHQNNRPDLYPNED